MVTAVTTIPLMVGLDPEQYAAVTSTAAPLVVVAAAGSGKTTVLTRRIAHRVAIGTADAAHVLALTFTRDAAGELRRRLRSLDLRTPVEAGTFHAVALRLLRDRAEAAGRPAPQVASDRHRLVREVLTELGIRADPAGVLADLDWCRAREVAPSDLPTALQRARRRPSLSAGRITPVIEGYEQLKRRRGIVDFDDLLVDLVDSMQRDASWADVVRWRFRHLFVDEAQDLNPLQFRVLEAIRGGRPDLCLVGDPRQSIYAWNGADPSLLGEVERHFPGVTVLSLHRNYRCTPQILRVASQVLVASGQADESTSEQPAGTPVRTMAFTDEHEEAREVARHAATRAHRARVAVLARTNDLLAPVERALTALGARSDRSAGRSALDIALRDAFACTGRERLAEWADRVFADDASTDAHRRVSEEVDRFLTSGVAGSFRAWIESRPPLDTADDDEPVVSLLTFHAAKGREWNHVVVIGTEEGLVPHSSASTPAQRAEEARLLYVALTRATDDLVVTRASSRSGKPTTPCRWLDQALASAADPPAVAPPAVTRRVDPLASLREWRQHVARAAGMSEQALCSDRVLRGLLESPPTDLGDLADRLGMTPSAVSRIRPLPTPHR